MNTPTCISVNFNYTRLLCSSHSLHICSGNNDYYDCHGKYTRLLTGGSFITNALIMGLPMGHERFPWASLHNVEK